MKPIKQLCIGAVLAGFLFLGATDSAKAGLITPTISVDLDPGTPGVQSSLSVAQGTTFTVDVVVTDAPGSFDAAISRILFNTSGPVLTLASANPIAGALVGFGVAAFTVRDFYGGSYLAPGDPLTFGPSETPPFIGESTSAAGYYAESGAITGVPPTPVSILSMDFYASSLGISSLQADGSSLFNGGPGAAGLSAINGGPYPILFGSGSANGVDNPIFSNVGPLGLVTVTSPLPTPESGSTLAMLGLVAAGLAGVRRRK